MKKLIHLLDITSLSQVRKYIHPSFYGHGGHRNMDCSHWCLVGVLDTQNQLLYASLILKCLGAYCMTFNLEYIERKWYILLLHLFY
jgi:hypothetical protein